MEAELELLADERSRVISEDEKQKGELRGEAENVRRGSDKT